jgi:transcriptional regulator with XRE-family HTH domain
MSVLAHNIAFLRKQRQLSQQALSDRLNIPRSTLSGYEQSYAEPDIDTIIHFSQFFDVDLNLLLTQKLSDKKGDQAWLTMKNNQVAVSPDDEVRNYIQLVDTKAEAGYMESFNDPEFIRDLPSLKIPQVPRGFYRAFEIQGDSMLPLEPGSIVIASWVERLAEVKSGFTYIVASKEGLVYKRVYQSSHQKKLRLVSDNGLYEPYELAWEHVQEVWKFYAFLSFSDGKNAFDNMIEEKQERLYKQMDAVHQKICTE